MHIHSLIWKSLSEQKLLKEIRQSTNRIKNSRNLTSTQETEIKQYWHELIGINIPLDWHRYFYKRTGIYSVRYIPSSLYYIELIGRFNRFPMNTAYTDKNISTLLLPAEYQPKVVIKNMNGHYYIDNQPSSKQEAILVCRDLDDVLIKPSLERHGDGVRKFSVKKGITSINGKTIEQLFADYKSDFVVQNIIHQHEKMEALNNTSVNTIRILTYHSVDEVLVLYSVIRIGRQGAEIDNESAGGISTRINADGTLSRYAYGAPGNDSIEKTDTGIELAGYPIPSYSRAIALVKEMHLLLPHFDLVGWDIAIDTEGNPIIIEFNTWPELSQSANGPAFGEYTERIMNEIWWRPNTRSF